MGPQVRERRGAGGGRARLHGRHRRHLPVRRMPLPPAPSPRPPPALHWRRDGYAMLKPQRNTPTTATPRTRRALLLEGPSGRGGDGGGGRGAGGGASGLGALGAAGPGKGAVARNWERLALSYEVVSEGESDEEERGTRGGGRHG